MRMNSKRLILLTNTWPFDSGETFIDNEAGYLSEAFESVEVFPLYHDGTQRRSVPSNFHVHKPSLKKNPKEKFPLLVSGIFSTAPLFFAIKELFSDKCLTGKKLWNLCTGTLTFRASYPTLKRFGLTNNDVLYSYWGDKWSASLSFVKEISGCKCVARFHGTDLFEEVKGYIPFRKALFNSLDAAFPISDAGAKYIKERYNYNGYVKVARLGVPKAVANPPSDGSCFKIVSCSNVIPLKRLDLIANALPLLDFPIKWTHIGDGVMLTSIMELCRNFPSHISVDFKGRLSNSDVRKLYATEHFDIFLNVSSSEGLPVSIMEAFSQGIPALATNVGGTSEIVDSTVGGLLPACITPENLALAIREIRDNYTNTIRENALERWSSMCDASINYKAFSKALLSV